MTVRVGSLAAIRTGSLPSPPYSPPMSRHSATPEEAEARQYPLESRHVPSWGCPDVSFNLADSPGRTSVGYARDLQAGLHEKIYHDMSGDNSVGGSNDQSAQQPQRRYSASTLAMPRDTHPSAYSSRYEEASLAFQDAISTISSQPDRQSEDEETLDSSVLDDDDAVEKTKAERLAEKRKMKRFRLTHAQTRFLMSEFARQAHPDASQRERLSCDIPGLSPRQVQVWFQNRRAKLKRLTIDDQERMMSSRALPEDFALPHIPHPAHGMHHTPSEPITSLSKQSLADGRLMAFRQDRHDFSPATTFSVYSHTPYSDDGASAPFSPPPMSPSNDISQYSASSDVTNESPIAWLRLNGLLAHSGSALIGPHEASSGSNQHGIVNHLPVEPLVSPAMRPDSNFANSVYGYGGTPSEPLPASLDYQGVSTRDSPFIPLHKTYDLDLPQSSLAAGPAEYFHLPAHYAGQGGMTHQGQSHHPLVQTRNPYQSSFFPNSYVYSPGPINKKTGLNQQSSYADLSGRQVLEAAEQQVNDSSSRRQETDTFHPYGRSEQ